MFFDPPVILEAKCPFQRRHARKPENIKNYTLNMYVYVSHVHSLFLASTNSTHVHHRIQLAVGDVVMSRLQAWFTPPPPPIRVSLHAACGDFIHRQSRVTSKARVIFTHSGGHMFIVRAISPAGSIPFYSVTCSQKDCTDTQSENTVFSQHLNHLITGL